MIELSAEQRQELARERERPLQVVDPETKKVYFIVSDDLFARVRALFADDDLDVRDTYAAQSATAGAAGWDDPEMDVYDQYDAHRPKP